MANPSSPAASHWYGKPRPPLKSWTPIVIPWRLNNPFKLLFVSTFLTSSHKSQFLSVPSLGILVPRLGIESWNLTRSTASQLSNSREVHDVLKDVHFDDSFQLSWISASSASFKLLFFSLFVFSAFTELAELWLTWRWKKKVTKKTKASINYNEAPFVSVQVIVGKAAEVAAGNYCSACSVRWPPRFPEGCQCGQQGTGAAGAQGQQGPGRLVHPPPSALILKQLPCVEEREAFALNCFHLR